MKLNAALGKKDKQTAPQWQPDFQRILDGDPYTIEGMSEAEIARHKGVRCPEPVRVRQDENRGIIFCVEHAETPSLVMNRPITET
jgi:hypothetical protein